MGREFLIVNPDKRQFIDPNRLGENAKSSGYMTGWTANAVALLVCKPTGVRHEFGDLAGEWCGDRVSAAGDEWDPNQDGIVTASADDPQRNLHQMARDEFTDISLDVVAMMSRGSSWFAEGFAERAKRAWDARFFIELCSRALRERNRSLCDALASVNGSNWIAKYLRACDKYEIEPVPIPDDVAE